MPWPRFPHNASLGKFVRRELRELTTIKPSARPWQFPLAVAVAVGLPLTLGAWLDEMRLATLGALGAMTIVYLPRTRLDHRLASLMAVAFAMTVCHLLGQVSQLVPAARVPVIVLVTIIATMGCRHYKVVPPGPLFFVMAASIGAFAPGEVADLPMRLGVFAIGTISAVAIGFLYSAHILRRREPLATPAWQASLHETIIADSLLIGLFVGLSLGAAQVLSIDKPYWAPVSCLAVIQGVDLRAVWNRQAQRIVGTLLGLGLTWALIRYAAGPWAVAVALMTLTFCIETAVVRQYAFAAIFITPLTILLAEGAIPGTASSSGLMNARLADTIVGSLFGLLGGIVLHSPLRRKLTRLLRARTRRLYAGCSGAA